MTDQTEPTPAPSPQDRLTAFQRDLSALCESHGFRPVIREPERIDGVPQGHAQIIFLPTRN